MNLCMDIYKNSSYPHLLVHGNNNIEVMIDVNGDIIDRKGKLYANKITMKDVNNNNNISVSFSKWG